MDILISIGTIYLQAMIASYAFYLYFFFYRCKGIRSRMNATWVLSLGTGCVFLALLWPIYVPFVIMTGKRLEEEIVKLIDKIEGK